MIDLADRRTIKWWSTIDCRLDVQVREEVRLEVGSLELKLPAAVTPREELRLEIHVAQQFDGEHVVLDSAPESIRLVETPLTFDGIFAGTYVARFELIDASITTSESGRRGSVLSRVETPFVIRRGETTVIQLP